MKLRQALLVAGFVIALLFAGLLRNAAYEDSFLTPFAGYATVVYVLATVVFLLLLANSGVRMDHAGFGIRFRLRHLVLAAAAVACLQLSAAFIGPVLESLFGAGRDLDRFSDVQGSVGALLKILVFSWLFAAFGEEIAFRIVLLRGLRSVFGGTTAAGAAAVVVQAAVFGMVHLYQGSTGIAGVTISGLIFGTVTLMARGAIWPAALAHGTNNTIGLLVLYSAGPR